MAIKMVREPSETPNINNIDDIVPMRYAYGNQNGYVIGKGTEISNTVNGLNFTINSGRLVLQGVECDIDASGVTITIDNIATKRYYTVYLEVNLGLNTATIKSEYDTATYPSIDAGDDLTENTTGIARLPLYQFTATSGIIGEVNKVVESVKYAKDIKVNNSINSVNTVNAIKLTNNTFQAFTKNDDDVLFANVFICPTLELLFDSGEQPTILSANEESSITINNDIDIEKDTIIFEIPDYGYSKYYVLGENIDSPSSGFNLSYSRFTEVVNGLKATKVCYSANVAYQNRVFTFDTSSYSAKITISYSPSGSITSQNEILSSISINKIYRLKK